MVEGGLAVTMPVGLGLVERARLARFFTALAVKEHLWPRLHVRPLVAELFLTDNCNLRCVSCACWRTTTRRELTTDEWRSVIDQLVGLRILKVNFTGGEPLLRRDAAELMAHARAAGVRSIHLNTNAILLDEARQAEILDAGVRSFNISVDGPDGATHDAVRGQLGAFDRTIAHLEQLLASRRELGLAVRLNFTVLRANVHTLPDVADLAQRLGVRLYLNLGTDTTFLFRDQQVTSLVHIRPDELRAALARLEEHARVDRRLLPRFSDLRYVRHHFAELVQPQVPCAESQLKLMVHSTGEVGGCWGHDAVDNVRDRPLSAIVDSAHYRDEHTRFFRKDCVGCGSNYSLNLRWRPRTYLDDLRWRLGRLSLTDESVRG